MLNTIRADVYRLLHGKAIYVTFAVYLGLIIMQFVSVVAVSSQPVMGVQVSYDEVSEVAVIPPSGFSFTASSASLLVMSNFQLLVFIALALIYAVSGADFNFGTAQNTVAAGLSRGTVYFSKLITSFVLIELFYLVILVAAALVGAAMGGAGDESFVPSFLSAFGTQSLMVLALASTGTALACITRKGAALIATYLVIFVGAAAVLFTVGAMLDVDLTAYDFLTASSFAAIIGELPFDEAVKVFVVTLIYLAASMVLGPTLFRRAEIR
jgi:ABC-2 type transport system permease protein